MRFPSLNWPFPSRSPPCKKHSAGMFFLYRKWSFSWISPPSLINVHFHFQNRLMIDFERGIEHPEQVVYARVAAKVAAKVAANPSGQAPGPGSEGRLVLPPGRQIHVVHISHTHPPKELIPTQRIYLLGKKRQTFCTIYEFRAVQKCQILQNSKKSCKISIGQKNRF